MHETHGRLVTIMFVQVTENTAHSRERPVSAIVWPAYNNLLQRHVRQFHGELIEVRNGEIFASFPGAELAFNAALSLKSVMHSFNLRIGLHLGEVLFRQGKFQGADVNFASRLPACARAGGICMSQSVYQYLPQKIQQKLIALGSHELKNFASGASLYACLPDGQACRGKIRELRRLLNTELFRYRKQLLLFCLLTVSAAFSWHHYTRSQGSPKPVYFYFPGIEDQWPQTENAKQTASLVMNLQSRLAQFDEIHLTEVRAAASFELIISMSRDSSRDVATTRLDYIVNSVPDQKVVARGYVEKQEQQLFELQDRIADKITGLLKQQKIIDSSLASDSVSTKLDNR